MLRGAGVPASVDQLGRFVRALRLSAPGDVDGWYWAGRLTLASDPGHIDAYDRVFAQVFRGLYDPADARGDPNAPLPAHTRPARDRSRSARPPEEGSGGGDEHASVAGAELREREVEVAFASRAERLATTDFAKLSEEELAELGRLMRDVRVHLPLRRARRRRRHRHGDRLDLRATIRRSRRTGGDPIGHVTRRATERPRRLVVLCDISGSMAPYARACIQLLHVAAGSRRAEVFTFATRLTRLTRVLKVPDADAALELAGTSAPDWRGGTRIGAGLKEFVDRYGRAGMARGAVVVIVSDGWDLGEPGLVAEQMARLGRLARRVVWVNPRRSAPGFAPLAGGMAAALPYCDALVGGRTLAELALALATLDERPEP